MRQLKTTEQSGTHDLGRGDMASQRLAAYRHHLGSYPMEISYETRQARPIEPSELSDAELTAQIELLAAQQERIEVDRREGLAEAKRAHGDEKPAFTLKLNELIAHVNGVSQELLGSQLRVDLTAALQELQKAADALRQDMFQPRSLVDVYPSAPNSLAIALDGCRKEQQQRQAALAAEDAKILGALRRAGFTA